MKRLPILLFCTAFSLQILAQDALNQYFEKSIQKNYSYLEKIYKNLHQHPELSFQEEKTSQKLATELRTWGYEVTEKIGGFGIVGVLKNGEGPTVLIRADMDALPIKEETNLAYASTVSTNDITGDHVPVMHACGHDMHMTVWLGTAHALATNKKNWSGTVVFIGQPAEERSGGAKAMLKDGLYEQFPQPDYAIALHVSANLPAGTIGYCPEYAMANVDMLNITIYGEGGHGAYPHTTIDPIVVAAKLILDLQTIVSREVSPLDPAVVTVGSIHGGAKGNVIPNEVELKLTMRSYSDEVRDLLIKRIEEKCIAAAESADLHKELYPKVELLNEFTPSLYNDPSLTERMANVFIQTIGAENVKEVPPVMAGEDFGRYGRTEEDVPIMLYWLGAVDPVKVEEAARTEMPLPSLHSSKFAPLPEPTIKTGVRSMTAAVLHLLKG